MELAEKNWFSSWFDTPYYHILYKDRDEKEAREFMQNLTSFLEMAPGAAILDLACGKGRHSIYLNELGFDVTGVDLSENSIQHASQYENESLRFQTHCMCEPLEKAFDGVFNLFTSFGYFEQEADNLRAIRAIRQELGPNGYGVIDFMNVQKVIERLVYSETKIVDGIEFHITRRLREGYILKDIRFMDEDREHSYTEKVKAISLQQFRTYLQQAGLRLLHTFGSYELEPFDAEASDRLILVFSR